MRLKPEAIILLLFAYLSFRIFTIAPESDQTFDFFPLYEAELTLRTHIWIISGHLSRMLMIRALYISTTHGRRYLDAIFIMEAIDVADYMLIYNESWFKIATFNVEFGDIKLAGITLIAIIYMVRLWMKNS